MHNRRLTLLRSSRCTILMSVAAQVRTDQFDHQLEQSSQFLLSALHELEFSLGVRVLTHVLKAGQDQSGK